MTSPELIKFQQNPAWLLKMSTTSDPKDPTYIHPKLRPLIQRSMIDIMTEEKKSRMTLDELEKALEKYREMKKQETIQQQTVRTANQVLVEELTKRNEGLKAELAYRDVDDTNADK